MSRWLPLGFFLVLLGVYGGIRYGCSPPSRDISPVIYSRLVFWTDQGETFRFVQWKDSNFVVLIHLFFTRCPGACPRMIQTLKNLLQDLQKEIPEEILQQHFRIVSVSVDPLFDTPATLYQYRERWDLPQNVWWLVSGPRASVYRWILDTLQLIAISTETRQIPDFVHSEEAIIMDVGNKKIVDERYDLLDSREVARLRSLLLQLLSHEFSSGA